ncbi:NADAR family protein [Chitinophaga sp. GbtcB8]|uniref:NADAR family protein n=1 Tax=Chitinophaga sp. GbtcB8 TaxID=2824753 RepID=UPI001C305DDC|nr:NADAR family protein [Chitinophaga sp. GbtcB8]
MKYNNDWLRDKYNTGEQLKYIFFWGHQPSKDGTITKTCFSQWWMAPFKVDGITYPTAEHWMMAGKARLFNDTSIIEKILQADTPGAVKQLGREIKTFEPSIWDEQKFNIVVTGNQHKFSQHKDLKTFLLNTGDRVLVEASPVDTIWGIGMATDRADITNPLLWKGENLLGYVLMEVRDKLK